MTTTTEDLFDTFGEEDLDPELAEWICEGHFGPALKHPLVFQVPYFPQINKIANRSLVAKREALVKAEEEERWHSYVFLHERPYRIDAFREIEWRLTDKQYWELLSSVWTDTENLWQWGDIRSLLKCGRTKRRRYFMDDDGRAALALLPENVTLYRGHTDENRDGWSWTIDRSKAEWFAQRFDHKGEAAVREITVPKRKIIAYFTDRGEEEVVIDPKGIA